MMNNELLDSAAFSALLEKVMKNKELTYIEAILEVCHQKGLDQESVPSLLTPKLKKLVQAEAIALHMMKPKKRRKRRGQDNDSGCIGEVDRDQSAS
jgi:hypothetical protein